MHIYALCTVLLLPLCWGKTLFFGPENLLAPAQTVVETETETDSAPKHWALVIAGSSGWYNYRHQADACHSYHVMLAHGIPDERIVVMMYDDIAHSDNNPTPGVVINRPGGKDVYHGVPKDYTGKDVTPENFLKILQGQDMSGIGSGKVIKSGPNDNVFVNFADHGAPGLIAFPHGELHAKDLNDAIKSMHQNNLYKKMVLYIEACESGSMFDGLLPKDINVFATTAANGHESSYACYFDKKRETYLGDVYSVKWMEDSDTEDLKSETLSDQFKIVKTETNTSHVQEYGDLSMGSLPVAQFQGGANLRQDQRAEYENVPLNAVPQEDVPLAIVRYQLEAAVTPLERQKALAKYHDVIEQRINVDETFEKIVRLLTNHKLSFDDVTDKKVDITEHRCYKRAVSAVSKDCFVLGQVDYALRHLYKLVNLCENGVNPRAIELVVREVCGK